ncbi:ABC transporter permease [Paenibacillus popilliae]|uniref:Uncharacterized protein n=1 Tax=Paenibacillus popilliae ATCC 14706 TaxID=1212764 RepID=M9LPA9_PAEPP|nr:ABC transporter permease [Paenibacillus popilliae]GAC42331.1 hypothetical protein PPOP_1688 [Paenibacillus popilliae ATCC 14706]
MWAAFVILIVYLLLGYSAFLRVHIEVGQFLQSSGYIGMAASIVGFLMGMLSARREQTYCFAETLASVPGDSIRIVAKLAAWSLVVLIFTCLAALEIIGLVVYVHSEFILFGGMLFSYIFLYWGMTLLSCGYIGYAVETLFPSRWWSLILLFMLWILTSPLNQFILYVIPSTDVAKWMTLPLSYLNQGEKNLETAYQEVEGLRVSFDIWMKKLFFFLLAIIAVCVAVGSQKHREKTTNERKKTIGLLFVSIIFASIAGCMATHPLDRGGIRSYELLYYENDYHFYRQYVKTEDPLSTTNVFEVDHYDLILSKQKNKISYTATLSIHLGRKQNDWLPFTLYHGLQVSNVKLNDQTIEWKREGDVLHIEWPNLEGSMKISMDVNGETGVLHPIKDSSYFLAADFPWIPVPGIYNVANVWNGYELLTFHSIRSKKADYQITIRSSDSVFSNLPEVQRNVFAGKASGVSLLSGKLIGSKDGNVTVVRPPDRLRDADVMISDIQNRIDEIAHLLEVESFNLREDISNVFVVPYYSYEHRNSMKYMDGTLYINDKYGLSNYQAVTHSSSIFYTFFWNNQYREREAHNPVILHALIEFLASENIQHTSLYRSVENIPSQGTNVQPIQFLYKAIADAYHVGKVYKLNQIS